MNFLRAVLFEDDDDDDREEEEEEEAQALQGKADQAASGSQEVSDSAACAVFLNHG